MEEGKASESHMASAAAFVEGGLQEAYEDACSICLEAFCDSDPSTLTNCKHEYHLQCILEWCQRSSQCPMCLQPISFKDPDSQELLDAVEHERNIRMNPPRNTAIFHHPTLGDFELQHLPVSASESELEERIIQHLAAAAAMGRARHFARREGQRNRTNSQGRPHVLVFSTHPNGASGSSVGQRDGNPPPAVMIAGPNSPFITVGEDSTHLTARSPEQADHPVTTAPGSSSGPSQHGTTSNNRSPLHTSPNSQDRAGPSDFQSFSDSLKSRLSALSSRYKESITKSTRGWKERLFARNNNNGPESVTEIRREADQGNGTGTGNGNGNATVTRMMDHLAVADDGRPNTSTPLDTSDDAPAPVEMPAAADVVSDSHSPNNHEGRAPCAGSASN
ncbi:E3 ubiquitin-protein ligase RHF2A isoform X2 [Andrographis paniculata]|uniref:E3 ubiquitin-protein ligase RHF2A isoform X2 n=1 Tax=Andrographis paniculata TaxID=175694 RepID=UPI0021E999F5|nr:E3 ubiquitin-protein ligase RHF2A isoform X2 [Andrographis paniculata]